MSVYKVKPFLGDGGSGGEGVTYGMGMWVTGEGDVARENQKLGGYFSIGVGANGNVAEGHVTIAETSPTFYPFEFINSFVIKDSMINREGKNKLCEG